MTCIYVNKIYFCLFVCLFTIISSFSFVINRLTRLYILYILEMSEMCEIATIILGIEQSQMERYFTHRRIAASHSRRQSVFYRPCTQQQAISRRDCLAMLLYSRSDLLCI